jgi:hypothetical protein
MALFTDGTISTMDELAEHDSGVLQAARTESIDLTRKLALAQEEIGVELAALLPDTGSTLGSVVVTSGVRLWHVFHTLALTYRDAYYSQLNDRYQGKWKEYVELARWAAAKVMQTGVGIAADPVARAARPALITVAGSLPEGTVYVTAAWLNARGEEGACAAAGTIEITAGTTFRAAMGPAPANARAWNVYAGPLADSLTRQNATPVSVGETWIQQTALTGDGEAPGEGQAPNFLRALPRLLQRG